MWIEKIKNYNKQNAEKIKEKHKIPSHKYHIKNRDGITDAYCISKLKNQYKDLTDDDIIKNPELIEIKRIEILNHRVKLQILKHKTQ